MMGTLSSAVLRAIRAGRYHTGRHDIGSVRLAATRFVRSEYPDAGPLDERRLTDAYEYGFAQQVEYLRAIEGEKSRE